MIKAKINELPEENASVIVTIEQNSISTHPRVISVRCSGIERQQQAYRIFSDGINNCRNNNIISNRETSSRKYYKFY